MRVRRVRRKLVLMGRIRAQVGEWKGKEVEWCAGRCGGSV
jgi:hypothetical protein